MEKQQYKITIQRIGQREQSYREQSKRTKILTQEEYEKSAASSRQVYDMANVPVYEEIYYELVPRMVEFKERIFKQIVDDLDLQKVINAINNINNAKTN